MSVLSLIQNHHELSLVDADENIWSYTDETPAAQFHTFLTPADHERILLCATFKTGGTAWVKSVLNQAKAFIETHGAEKPLSLCPCQGLAPFDAVAVISPAAHKMYKTYDPSLHAATRVVFPVYQCELKGDETPGMIDMIRHDFLPSLEWDRQPHPQIRASYMNASTGVGSTVSRPGLAGLARVTSILKQMDGCDSSWLRVQNWLGEERVFKFNQAYHCEWSRDHKTKLASFEDAAAVLKSFCIDGGR